MYIKTVTSIKALGGPTIGWSSGRVDQPVEAVTPDGRLPNADSGKPLADKADGDHLRNIFYRMGFDDRFVLCFLKSFPVMKGLYRRCTIRVDSPFVSLLYSLH